MKAVRIPKPNLISNSWFSLNFWKKAVFSKVTRIWVARKYPHRKPRAAKHNLLESLATFDTNAEIAAMKRQTINLTYHERGFLKMVASAP